MNPDIINGLFEALGGLFVFNHCRAVIRDKDVKGVSIISVIFFSAWGYWNLFYYPHLNQLWSFVGGIVIVSANTIWWILLIKYWKRNRRGFAA